MNSVFIFLLFLRVTIKLASISSPFIGYSFLYCILVHTFGIEIYICVVNKFATPFAIKKKLETFGFDYLIITDEV